MNDDLKQIKIKEDICLLKEIKQYEAEFIDLIRDRLGIVIHSHQTREMQKTIASACNTFSYTPIQYLEVLKKCEDPSPLLDHLISGVTVGETYFFRDKRQIELLKNILLPEIIHKKRKKNDYSLRIWSAGCASGEEIYTIALILSEILPDLHKWNVNLLGTDINHVSLQKAISGIYGEWSMRSITDQAKEQYFTKEEGRYNINAHIRNMVKFEYLNLNTDIYPSIFNGTNALDLIMCRNVLIYFDNDSIANLMKKFTDCLVPGAYLMLGASDPVNIKNTQLNFLHDMGMLFSRKIKPEKELMQSSSIMLNSKIEKKEIFSYRAQPMKEMHVPVKAKINYDVLTNMLEKAQWQDALNIININENHEKPSSFLLNAKATALANLGQLNDAKKTCEISLSIENKNKYTYYLHSLVLLELNEFQQAENSLRKALFLDREFVAGHYQLGLLLLRNKQNRVAIKSLKNALAIAKRNNSSQSVPGHPNLTFDQLVELLECEINLYNKAEGNVYAK